MIFGRSLHQELVPLNIGNKPHDFKQSFIFFSGYYSPQHKIDFPLPTIFLFLKNGVEFSDIWELCSSFSKAQSSVTAWRVSPFAFMPCMDTFFTLLLLYIPLPAFFPINHIQRMFFIQYLSQYPIFMCLTNTS